MMDWVRRATVFKKLSKKFAKRAGRNNSGRITVRHRGGGFKVRTKIIDRFRTIWNHPAIVISIEQARFVSTRLALVAYPLGILTYITAPQGLKIGDTLIAGWKVDSKQVGNAMPLINMPLNIKIHNIESFPGSGAVFARAAGTWAMIVEKTPGRGILVVLRSGIKKFLSPYCLAVIGRVGNSAHRTVKFYKAGQTRKIGIRPTVRGVAMNPVDHPHGGGKGKKSKNAVPQSPWGKLGKWQKTTPRR